jgi:putative aldouronate transport system permease protein
MRIRSKGEAVFSVFNTVFMIFMMVITLYPMYYCVIASFSNPVKLALNPGFILLPLKPLTIGAYEKVLQHSLFISGAYNTIFVVLVGTALNMIFTILTGYALSRKGFMLKKLITFFIAFTMYFSGGLIPGYLNVKSFGLINSLWALIIPGAISTYNMIIMRTAFSSVPDSLAESAQMDGAKHLTILLRIMIPLSKPTIAVLVLYYAVGHWNAWFNAFIYLQEPSKFPLQLVMRNILRSVDVSEMLVDVGGEDQARYVELIKYALIVVSTVPILILYPFLQKYFVKGIMIGAIKG